MSNFNAIGTDGAVVKRSVGRQPSVDWYKVLDALSDSGNLTKALRETGGHSKAGFLAAVAGDKDLADAYARAREVGLDAEADRAIEEALHAEDAALGRLALDARKWYLSKLLPRKYGDKLAVGGADDLPEIAVREVRRTIVDPHDP